MKKSSIVIIIIIAIATYASIGQKTVTAMAKAATAHTQAIERATGQ